MICKAWPHTKPPSSKLINNHVLSNNIGSKTSINHRHVICLVLCPCDILCLLWVYVYVLFIYYIPCLFLFDFLFCYCGFVYVGRNLRGIIESRDELHLFLKWTQLLWHSRVRGMFTCVLTYMHYAWMMVILHRSRHRKKQVDIAEVPIHTQHNTGIVVNRVLNHKVISLYEFCTR